MTTYQETQESLGTLLEHAAQEGSIRIQRLPLGPKLRLGTAYPRSSASPACQNAPSRKPSSCLPTESRPGILGASLV